MKKINNLKYGGIYSLLGLCFTLFSCTPNKTQHSSYFTNWETAPKQSMYQTTTRFTDSGKTRMLLESPEIYNFDDKENKIQIFPKGIRSHFFEDGNKETVLLTADSAINISDQNLMKFYKHVVIYDHRSGDTIFTDAIYWDQDKRTIYSDRHVLKKSSSLVLEGSGFDADDQLINIRLRNPRGVFN